MKIFVTLFLSFICAVSFAQDKTNPNLSPSLSLDDLGFSANEIKVDQSLDNILKDRRSKLEQHQLWGLWALGGMALTVLSAGEGELPPEHAVLAGATAAAYGISAWYAYSAPERPTTEESGGSLWHRRLMWVHLPGMVLAPILGYMAAKKIEDNEKLDGIEKYHKDVGFITAGALALSVVSVSFEF